MRATRWAVAACGVWFALSGHVWTQEGKHLHRVDDALRRHVRPAGRRSEASDPGCDRVAGGPLGSRDRRIDLSAAHALVRAFSAISCLQPLMSHSETAAETFMQMLVGAHRLTAIVGGNSAGSNANITELSLPEGFVFMYAGMEVLNPDGSRFEGLGITPDVMVPVTAGDLRDGIDRDLLTAIGILKN